MGSTSAINSDKTGTLTLNQMTARQLTVAGNRFAITGEGYSTEGIIKHAGGQGVDVLDPMLIDLVENDKTAFDLIEAGGDEAVVKRIARLVDIAEFKRRQSPPGPRVTPKAFGRDRRMPITNRYRGGA